MRLELAIQDLKLSNQSQDPGAKEGHLEVLLDCSLLACVAGSLGRIWHLAVAVSLGGILLLGGLNNLLVLLLFAKFPVIRTPLNLLLLNLSLSDLLACLLGTSFGFASSLRGRWLFGEAGCRWYGVANVLFGIVSLVSLSILSYERYMTVLRKPSKSMTSSYSRSFLCIGGTWLYSLSWTLPPLFIWSSFGPQKPGESCSVTWFPKTASNFSYIICLFIFCLIFPLVALTYCYGRILQIIRKQASRFPVKAVQRREQRILFMVVTMVTCYFLCWVPYGIVVLITVFGKPGTVTPLISIVPSILAKASTIVNPILYVLLNKQVGEEMSLGEDVLFLRRLQKCRKPQDGEATLLDCAKVLKSFQDLQDPTSKVPQESALAMQKGDKRPSATIHLAGSKDSNKVLQWKKSTYAPTDDAFSYQDGKLTVARGGRYYIYSQVAFCTNPVPHSPFSVNLYLHLPFESDKLLLKGVGTHGGADDVCGLQSIHLGRAVELQPGHAVFVNVTDSSRVNYDHGNTYFGMFELS